MTTRWIELAYTELADSRVRLRPVTESDRESIREVAMDPHIWHYFVSKVENEADYEALFDAMLIDQKDCRRVVFHILDLATGRTAGSMSYGNMSESDGRLEIGWSWLGRDFRGQGVNVAAKYLMLQHAFEVLEANRVEFKTDRRNEQARRGLRNIGATEEGTLRSYNPMPDGTRRDAVFFSVLHDEWPSIRKHLAPSENLT